MDLEHAKHILTVLSNGIHPITGEILPDSDSSNQLAVVRAINTVLRERGTDTGENTPSSKRTLPENSGKPWTEEDDAELCRMFDSGCSRKELSVHFKRTVGSISARLEKLGRIL